MLYVMGKALSGELSCTQTGLVVPQGLTDFCYYENN